MTVEVKKVETLTTAGLSLQRDIFEALIAANMETITREEQYAKRVQDIATLAARFKI